MSTTYEAGHKTRLYVKRSRQPMPPAGGNHAVAQREEREATIKLFEIGFQHRRFPGEEKWGREITPKKAVE